MEVAAEIKQQQCNERIKSRTPSGTDVQFVFRNSRNFFSPEKVDEENLTGNLRERSGSLSECEIALNNKPSVKLALTHSARRNSASSIVETVKTRASAKAISRLAEKNKQTSNPTDQSDSEVEFHTPPATPNRALIKKKGSKKIKGPIQSKWQVGVNHFFRNMKDEDKNSDTSMLMDQDLNDAPNQEEISVSKSTEDLRCDQPNESSTAECELTQQKRLIDLAVSAQKHIPDSEIPAVLDLQTVMKMFKKLQDNKSEDIDVKIQQHLKNLPQADAKTISNLEEELKWTRKKGRIMARTVQRMQDITLELASRIDNLEINNAKRCITITGYHTYGKKDAVIQQIEQFLSTDIGVPAMVEDTYIIGNSNPQTRVVVLMSQKDKHLILKNKSVLKDYDLQQPIYINDYQPPAAAERRRWEKELKSMNDKLPDDQRSDIQVGASAMYVDGAQYDPKVIPPGPEDILDLNDEQLESILKIKTPYGPKISQMNSEFKAYIICAENHQQVQDAYCRIRWIHAAARHIVCAYNLLQGPIYEKGGFCDDGEIGAGRRLLQLLQKNEIEARAVFVVRYYGGMKMGTDRFQCYEEAVKGAILAHPFNTITRWEQTLKTEQKENPSSTQSTALKAPTDKNQPSSSKSTLKPPADNRSGTQRGRSHNMGPPSLSKTRGSAFLMSNAANRGSKFNNWRGRGNYASRKSYSQITEHNVSHRPHLKRRRFSSPTEDQLPHHKHPLYYDNSEGSEHQWSHQQDGMWEREHSLN